MRQSLLEAGIDAIWNEDNEIRNMERRARRAGFGAPLRLGLNLAGAPNAGHRAEGFAGPRPDPELFVRCDRVPLV